MLCLAGQETGRHPLHVTMAKRKRVERSLSTALERGYQSMAVPNFYQATINQTAEGLQRWIRSARNRRDVHAQDMRLVREEMTLT